MLLGFAWLAAPVATAQPAREYQIKAVFLYHFAQFVEWPESAFASRQAPLVIGVLGEDPFGSFLDETVRGETVNGRQLTVRRFSRAEQVEACHILYVAASERSQMAALLPRLRERGILTVGDADRFTQLGGVIQFYTDQNKIRLRINVDAANAGNLRISSKLLRLAEIERG